MRATGEAVVSLAAVFVELRLCGRARPGAIGADKDRAVDELKPDRQLDRSETAQTPFARQSKIVSPIGSSTMANPLRLPLVTGLQLTSRMRGRSGRPQKPTAVAAFDAIMGALRRSTLVVS